LYFFVNKIQQGLVEVVVCVIRFVTVAMGVMECLL
jgi:hypothetical protein